MQAKAVNPATGEDIAVEISLEELDRLVREARPRVSRKDLERKIGKLSVPADVKALLDSLMNATVRIGNAVLYIGRRVLEIVLDLRKRYPNTTFAVVMWLVGELLSTVAPWLAPILVPLFAAIQLLYAFVKDWLTDRANKAAGGVEQADKAEGSQESDVMKILMNEPVGHAAREALQPFAIVNAEV